MKQTRIMWDMPITVEIVDSDVSLHDFDNIYKYFQYIDDTFSTFKSTSEISRINKGEIKRKDWSVDVNKILALAAKTKQETNGYFDINLGGKLAPLGLVKGWAVKNAADKLAKRGFSNFYLEAGGDIEVRGTRYGHPWKVGIRNPFNFKENIKVLTLSNKGIATSGTYLRGKHIYNPHMPDEAITDIVSLTIIGSDVCEADRFATAAFAMGKHGISFINSIKYLAGYMIDKKGIATFTSNFEQYVDQNS